MPDRLIKKSDDGFKLLDIAIKERFPDLRKQEVIQIRSNIIDYVSEGVKQGYEIGLIKPDSNPARIKVLTLVEKPRFGGLLSGGKEDK